MTDQKRIKVAIIEDTPEIQHMYKLKLEQEGFDVRAASDANNGIDLIHDFHPDVILLDIMMPEMTGIDLLTNIRNVAANDNIKVIMLTNLDDPRMKQSLALANISDYIVKAETTPSEVAEHIRQAVAKSDPQTPPKDSTT